MNSCFKYVGHEARSMANSFGIKGSGMALKSLDILRHHSVLFLSSTKLTTKTRPHRVVNVGIVDVGRLRMEAVEDDGVFCWAEVISDLSGAPNDGSWPSRRRFEGLFDIVASFKFMTVLKRIRRTRT